ncbi:MAG: HD domain-containing phosphohydrolase [Kangiellaceae bacterium]
MLLEKDISRVNIGSFVVKIIKQRGNNDEFRAGWIRDLKTIENLIDLGIEKVLVDTTKTLPSQQANIKKQSSTDNKVVQKIPLSFAEQLSSARALFERAAAVQANIQQNVADGGSLDLSIIKPIIDEMLEQVYGNGNALLCILNLRIRARYQIEHAVAVTVLMLVFSQYKEIKKTVAKELAIGAFIHDIGKVLIDESILNKEGNVSAVEFEVIKSHVNQSINIVKSTYGIPKLSQQVVAQHHEKLDGSGYPKGFDSRVISSYAQMLAICDIYDALSNSRVYKTKQSQVQAFANLMEMANDNLLDLSLVNQFIKCLGVYPVGSIVKLSNEQLAVVESRNFEQPLRPTVRALYNIRQKHFINSVNINLSNENTIEIRGVVDASDFGLDINKIIEFVILDG